MKMKMIKIGQRVLMILILITLFSFLNPLNYTSYAQDTLRVAKVKEITGTVKIMKSGGESSFKGFVGMSITQGDTIITEKDSEVTLEIDNDKEIKVEENSQIMIDELLKSLNGESTSIKVWSGGVWSNVKKKLNMDSKYEVETPTAVMGVRGTKFYVGYRLKNKDDKSDENGSLSGQGDTKIIVFEGSVSVKPTPKTQDGQGHGEEQNWEFILQNNEKMNLDDELLNEISKILEEINQNAEQPIDEAFNIFSEEIKKKVNTKDLDLFILKIIKEEDEGIDNGLLEGIDKIIKQKEKEKKKEQALFNQEQDNSMKPKIVLDEELTKIISKEENISPEEIEPKRSEDDSTNDSEETDVEGSSSGGGSSGGGSSNDDDNNNSGSSDVEVSNIEIANEVNEDAFQNITVIDLSSEKTSVAFKAKVYPENATNKELTWTSNNNLVATVNQEGLVTGKSEGETIITVKAKDKGGFSVSYKVKVIKNPDISNIEAIIESGSEIYEGNITNPVVISIKAYDQNNNIIENTNLNESTKIIVDKGSTEEYVLQVGSDYSISNNKIIISTNYLQNLDFEGISKEEPITIELIEKNISSEVKLLLKSKLSTQIEILSDTAFNEKNAPDDINIGVNVIDSNGNKIKNQSIGNVTITENNGQTTLILGEDYTIDSNNVIKILKNYLNELKQGSLEITINISDNGAIKGLNKIVNLTINSIDDITQVSLDIDKHQQGSSQAVNVSISTNYISAGTMLKIELIDVEGKSFVSTTASIEAGSDSINGTVVAVLNIPDTVPAGEYRISVESLENNTVKNETTIYTIVEQPIDTNLSALSISDVYLNPSFDSKITSYNSVVDYTIDQIIVTPTANDERATIKINGVQVTSGSSLQGINLQYGKNTINVTVEGSDIKTYTISIHRQNPPPPPPPPVTSISEIQVRDSDNVDPTALGGNYVININEAYYADFDAIVLPTDTSNKEVIWKSSNTQVAAIDQNGLITANSTGNTVITVTSQENNSVYISFVVEVIESFQINQVSFMMSNPVSGQGFIEGQASEPVIIDVLFYDSNEDVIEDIILQDSVKVILNKEMPTEEILTLGTDYNIVSDGTQISILPSYLNDIEVSTTEYIPITIEYTSDDTISTGFDLIIYDSTASSVDDVKSISATLISGYEFTEGKAVDPAVLSVDLLDTSQTIVPGIGLEEFINIIINGQTLVLGTDYMISENIVSIPASVLNQLGVTAESSQIAVGIKKYDGTLETAVNLIVYDNIANLTVSSLAGNTGIYEGYVENDITFNVEFSDASSNLIEETSPEDIVSIKVYSLYGSKSQELELDNQYYYDNANNKFIINKAYLEELYIDPVNNMEFEGNPYEVSIELKGNTTIGDYFYLDIDRRFVFEKYESFIDSDNVPASIEIGFELMDGLGNSLNTLPANATASEYIWDDINEIFNLNTSIDTSNYYIYEDTGEGCYKIVLNNSYLTSIPDDSTREIFVEFLDIPNDINDGSKGSVNLTEHFTVTKTQMFSEGYVYYPEPSTNLVEEALLIEFTNKVTEDVYTKEIATGGIFDFGDIPNGSYEIRVIPEIESGYDEKHIEDCNIENQSSVSLIEIHLEEIIPQVRGLVNNPNSEFYEASQVYFKVFDADEKLITEAWVDEYDNYEITGLSEGSYTLKANVYYDGYVEYQVYEGSFEVTDSTVTQSNNITLDKIVHSIELQVDLGTSTTSATGFAILENQDTLEKYKISSGYNGRILISEAVPDGNYRVRAYSENYYDIPDGLTSEIPSYLSCSGIYTPSYIQNITIDSSLGTIPSDIFDLFKPIVYGYVKKPDDTYFTNSVYVTLSLIDRKDEFGDIDYNNVVDSNGGIRETTIYQTTENGYYKLGPADFGTNNENYVGLLYAEETTGSYGIATPILIKDISTEQEIDIALNELPVFSSEEQMIVKISEISLPSLITISVEELNNDYGGGYIYFCVQDMSTEGDDVLEADTQTDGIKTIYTLGSGLYQTYAKLRYAGNDYISEPVMFIVDKNNNSAPAVVKLNIQITD